MAWHVPVNFAETTVTSGAINNTTSPLTFSVATGAVFGSSFPLYAVVDPAGVAEVIEITARSTNSITATRPNAVAHAGAPKIICAMAAEYLTEVQTAVDLKAPLASPALTGTPTAPTAAANTNTTQIATTAFVTTAVGAATANFAYATKTDAQTINSETWADVLTVSITPKTNTSKIKIEGAVMVGPHSNNAGCWLRIVRGTTAIGLGDTAGSRGKITAAYYPGDIATSLDSALCSVHVMWIDEPATTSSTTYKIQAALSTGGSGNVYINRSYRDLDTYDPRGISIITVTEV